MKPFNKALHNDVLKLKKLRVKEDKTEYKALFKKLLAKHKIAKNTLQTELRKDVPGSYGTVSWHMRTRPITEEEIAMVYELLRRQFTLRHIRKVMEERQGTNYSLERLYKVRKLISPRVVELEKNRVTTFGGSIQEIFRQVTNYELIDPTRIINIELLGKLYPVSCGVAKKAVDMIIFSAENGGKNPAVIQKIQIENCLTKKMEHISKSRHVSVQELRNAEFVRRSLEAGEKNSVIFSPDGKALMACCMELRPDLSYGEIYGIAMKHIKAAKGTTEVIEPDPGSALDEVCRAIEEFDGVSGDIDDELDNDNERDNDDNNNDEYGNPNKNPV